MFSNYLRSSPNLTLSHLGLATTGTQAVASVSNGSTAGSITHLGERIYRKVLGTRCVIWQLFLRLVGCGWEHHPPCLGERIYRKVLCTRCVIWQLFLRLVSKHGIFVQNFTPPDFQAKKFTASISPNFNSFSKKKHQKWVKMEKFTPLAKILHYRRHWRHGQIPPLQRQESLCGNQSQLQGGTPIERSRGKRGFVPAIPLQWERKFLNHN